MVWTLSASKTITFPKRAIRIEIKFAEGDCGPKVALWQGDEEVCALAFKGGEDMYGFEFHESDECDSDDDEPDEWVAEYLGIAEGWNGWFTPDPVFWEVDQLVMVHFQDVFGEGTWEPAVDEGEIWSLALLAGDTVVCVDDDDEAYCLVAGKEYKAVSRLGIEIDDDPTEPHDDSKPTFRVVDRLTRAKLISNGWSIQWEDIGSEKGAKAFVTKYTTDTDFNDRLVAAGAAALEESLQGVGSFDSTVAARLRYQVAQEAGFKFSRLELEAACKAEGARYGKCQSPRMGKCSDAHVGCGWIFPSGSWRSGDFSWEDQG